MEKIKIGLIGAGAIGDIHLAGFQKLEECELEAIASRTKNHAKQFAAKYEIDHYYFGDDAWKEMLNTEELDAVSICTPNYLHAPMILESIKHDLHILSEKPICITQGELDRVESALDGKELIFFVMFNKRFNPIFSIVKQILEEKLLGNLILARYYFSHYGPYESWQALSKQKWFFDSKLAGGGVLLDLGVHVVDLLRFLIGEPTRINGINFGTSCIDMKEEDNCNVLFEFFDNTKGLISVSWCNYPNEKIEIFGTEGTLTLDLRKQKPASCIPKKLHQKKLIKEALSFKKSHRETYHLLIEEFIHSILDNTQGKPDFEDGKRAVEFVLDAYSLK
ncbi:MAG: Gfo/Idh/MocA family oxidoreductase [Promethearchaeia archaeon]